MHKESAPRVKDVLLEQDEALRRSEVDHGGLEGLAGGKEAVYRDV
jgi:hypothetical protein